MTAMLCCIINWIMSDPDHLLFCFGSTMAIKENHIARLIRLLDITALWVFDCKVWKSNKNY